MFCILIFFYEYSVVPLLCLGGGLYMLYVNYVIKGQFYKGVKGK